MAIDRLSILDRRSRQTYRVAEPSLHKRRVAYALVLFSAACGLFAVALAMIISAVSVRLIAGDQPDGIKAAIVAIGTPVGAVVISLLAQPALRKVVQRCVLAATAPSDTTDLHG